MKIISFFLLLIVAVIITSCNQTNDTVNLIDGNYFPCAIGNYWIYERTTTDSTGKQIGSTVRDSLVVNDYKDVDGKIVFKLTMFRKGMPTETGYIHSSIGSIDTYNRGFMPFSTDIPFCSDDSSKCKKFIDRWLNIVRGNKKISHRDSVKGDNFPDMTQKSDSIVHYAETTISYAITYIRKDDEKIKIQDKIYQAISFDYLEEELYRFINGNQIWTKSDLVKLRDNGRTMVISEFLMNIKFVRDIGIAQFSETLTNGIHIVNHNYMLKDYKLF